MKKRRTLEQKTAQQLVPEADKWFSKYIRLRDAEKQDDTWVGECITCDRPLIVITDEGKWVASSQNGHFITRGVHKTRFDEYNCNLQCAHCNAWRDKESMLEAYRKAITDKYGSDILKELKQAEKAGDAYKRLPKQELLDLIKDCKVRIKWMLDDEIL